MARAETPCDVASGALAGAARGRPRRGRAGTGMCQQRAVLARVFAPMHAWRIVGSDLVPIARGAPRILRRPCGRGGVCAQKFLARRLDLAYLLTESYGTGQYSTARVRHARRHTGTPCAGRATRVAQEYLDQTGRGGEGAPHGRRLSTSTLRYGATRSTEALQQGVAAGRCSSSGG
jgi:hypothetical protein